MERIVGLLDIDYFFAQVEMISNPTLKGKPVVIVMPSLRENSGAIATCNYEARALKIRSGMPLSLAKKLANKETVFINADKARYEEMSARVFEIVDLFCEKVEQVSIDEAYIDISNPQGYGAAQELCQKIKQRIYAETLLTCSIGVGPNKVVAKLACSVKKPDGLFVVQENEALLFLGKQKIGDLFGVGPKYEEIFHKNGVMLVGDILKHSREELIVWFGDAQGRKFYDFAQGIDVRAIETNREKQQLSRIMTLKYDSSDFTFIAESTDLLSDLVFTGISRMQKNFKTVSLIAVTQKMESITRSRTVFDKINSAQELKLVVRELLKEYLSESLVSVRRIGVRVSNFETGVGFQKKLFEY